MALQKELAPLFEEHSAKHIKIKYDYAINNPNSSVTVHGFRYLMSMRTETMVL
ncbi:hypothetical protein GCM10022396_40100 [Flavivirga amylovorans]